MTHNPAPPPRSRSAAPGALPYAALLGSMISFCVGTSNAKQLFASVGATGAVSYRAGFAALILMAVFRPWRTALSRSDLAVVIRYGAVLGLMNLCFYMALRTIPLGIAIAIEFLGPLTVSLLHSHRNAHFLMVGMASAGLAMLLPLDGSAHALDPSGVGFAAAAGMFWALYIVFGKRTAHLPAGQTVAIGMATAACIVFPIGVVEAGTSLLSPSLALVGLTTAVLSSALPYSLEIVALRHLSANRFGILLSMEPAIGALAGVVILGEALGWLQWLAISLVVAASAGSVIVTGGEKKLSTA